MLFSKSLTGLMATLGNRSAGSDAEVLGPEFWKVPAAPPLVEIWTPSALGLAYCQVTYTVVGAPGADGSAGAATMLEAVVTPLELRPEVTQLRPPVVMAMPVAACEL